MSADSAEGLKILPATERDWSSDLDEDPEVLAALTVAPESAKRLVPSVAESNFWQLVE